MINYFLVRIDRTSKKRGEERYRLYNTEEIEFKTIEEAKNYIQETYAGKKRGKVCRDVVDIVRGMELTSKSAMAEHIGYFYQYTQKEEGVSYMCQDWITVEEVQKRIDKSWF